MSYQIIDTGASLRFVHEAGYFYIMKHHIKGIRQLRDDIIRIDTGCCLHSVFIHSDQVSEPVHADTQSLASILNTWITSFLQGYPDLPV